MLHAYMANDLRLNTLKTALVALYLRGGPGGSASASLVPTWRAPAVLDVLRVELSCCEFLDAEGAASALARRFLWEEAAVLRFAERWAWAASLVASGSVVSLLCSEYPARWRAVLGVGAPPVLYASRLGPALPLAGSSALPLFGFVGCRSLSAFGAFAASSAGTAVPLLSHALVSGGAEGADTLGAEACLMAGGSVVEVLPHGDLEGRHAFWADVFGSALGAAGGSWLGLSLYPPGTRFSTPFAMERNALIYSAGLSTFVVEARFGKGGTWVGARDCLRRRLGSLLVARDATGASSQPALVAKGAQSLCALGAVGVSLALPAEGGSVLEALRGALGEVARRADPLGLMVSEPFAAYGSFDLAS